jgi:hypothetical protein
VTAICRLNMDEDVFHVYAPNGLLLKRINYSRYRAAYGTPVAQSPNGRILAFRRSNTFLTMMGTDHYLKTKDVKRALCFSLLEMTPSGMRFIKIVNVLEGINLWFEEESGGGYGQFVRETSWLYTETFEEMQARLGEGRGKRPGGRIRQAGARESVQGDLCAFTVLL